MARGASPLAPGHGTVTLPEISNIHPFRFVGLQSQALFQIDCSRFYLSAYFPPGTSESSTRFKITTVQRQTITLLILYTGKLRSVGSKESQVAPLLAPAGASPQLFP